MPDQVDPLEQLLFGGAQPKAPQLPAEGLKRYLQLGVRGATLGFAGTQVPARDLPESAAELAGSVPTIAATSAVVSPILAPAARVIPLLRVPAISRVGGAIATGGLTGAVQALNEGKPMGQGALEGAAQFGALESGFLGASKLLGRAMKVSPKGIPTEPSPVASPAATEISRGMGVQETHPPLLQMPLAVRDKGVFDAKDFTGGAELNPARNPQLRQGRILAPEEVTRRMLPAGTPPKAIPESVGTYPGETQPFRPETYPMAEASGMFDRVYDEKIGQEVLVPKTSEVSEALNVAHGVDPHSQGELPFTPAQVQYLEEVKPELKQKLDLESRRAGLMAEDLRKQPPEVVEAATEKGHPAVEVHSIELTPTAMEARALMERAQIPEEDYIKFGATLKGTRDQKIAQLMSWLRERCK